MREVLQRARRRQARAEVLHQGAPDTSILIAQYAGAADTWNPAARMREPVLKGHDSCPAQIPDLSRLG
jgi:hypothetical protein